MQNTSGTCALVAASDFNAAHFREHDDAGEFSLVVAVDGGFAHLTSIARVPDAAIGDFDSLGFVPDSVEVKEYPSHKDESDLELALLHVAKEGYREVMVYGALGGRLDHTLASLQICARYAEQGMTVTLVGEDSAIRVLVGPDTFHIPALGRGVVSVFSATDEAEDVTEMVMEYELSHASLGNRTTLGLSNELIGIPASVSVGKGTLYVFYPI